MDKSQVCWKYRKLQSTTFFKGMFHGVVHKMLKNRGDEKVWTIAMAKKLSEVWGQIGKPHVITVNLKEHPLCIINVYMPSDNSNRDEQYKVILSQLEEIIDKFQCQYQILLCGDFNASLHRDNRPRDKCLQQFMENNGMKLVNGYPTKSTFYHHNQKSTSQIDY